MHYQVENLNKPNQNNSEENTSQVQIQKLFLKSSEMTINIKIPGHNVRFKKGIVAAKFKAICAIFSKYKIFNVLKSL